MSPCLRAPPVEASDTPNRKCEVRSHKGTKMSKKIVDKVKGDTNVKVDDGSKMVTFSD